MSEESIVLPEETEEGKAIMAAFQTDAEALRARYNELATRQHQAVLESSRAQIAILMEKLNEEIDQRQRKLQADLLALVPPTAAASGDSAAPVASEAPASAASTPGAAEPQISPAPVSAPPVSDAPAGPAGTAVSFAGGTAIVEDEDPEIAALEAQIAARRAEKAVSAITVDPESLSG